MSLAALLAWIKWVLTALSSELKSEEKLSFEGLRRAPLTTLLRLSFKTLLCAVLLRSLRIFLIADFISGMWEILT